MDRISAFLNIAKPNVYCDNCISMALNLDPEKVAETTASLGIGFARRRAKCTMCGSMSNVVAAS